MPSPTITTGAGAPQRRDLRELVVRQQPRLALHAQRAARWPRPVRALSPVSITERDAQPRAARRCRRRRRRAARRAAPSRPTAPRRATRRAVLPSASSAGDGLAPASAPRPLSAAWRGLPTPRAARRPWPTTALPGTAPGSLAGRQREAAPRPPPTTPRASGWLDPVLDRGRQRQHAARPCSPAAASDVGHPRAALRQRAGLVEGDRRRGADRLQRRAALDQQAAPGAGRQARGHGGGHRDHQRAGAGDQQQRQAAIEARSTSPRRAGGAAPG